jgi:hypothetical protein
MKTLLKILLAFAALAMPALPAAAAVQTGTPAWSIRPLTLYEGPGTRYDVVGGVDGKIRLYVDRCSDRWCQIHVGGSRGWVSEHDLAFGREPVGPLAHAFLDFKGTGPGRVCFYEGRNFSGTPFCGGPGYEVRDLLLEHLDNRFSSVSIEGNVSVIACRDRDLKSYCVRINDSQPVLEGFLDNAVTSFRIY